MALERKGPRALDHNVCRSGGSLCTDHRRMGKWCSRGRYSETKCSCRRDRQIGVQTKLHRLGRPVVAMVVAMAAAKVAAVTVVEKVAAAMAVVEMAGALGVAMGVAKVAVVREAVAMAVAAKVAVMEVVARVVAAMEEGWVVAMVVVGSAAGVTVVVKVEVERAGGVQVVVLEAEMEERVGAMVATVASSKSHKFAGSGSTPHRHAWCNLDHALQTMRS